MKAFKFCMVDIKRTKVKLLCLPAFVLIAFFFMMNEGKELMGVIYLTFCGLIMDSGPFMQDLRGETGFINMLPGTDRQRVCGRYIYGIMILAFLMIMSYLLLGVAAIRFNNINTYALEVSLLCFGIGLIISSLQKILFYILGNRFGQQFAALINILPSFVMFGIGISVVEYLDFDKIIQNGLAISIGLVVVSFIICIISMLISAKVVERRDFE